MSAPAQDGQAQAQNNNPLRQRINELRQNQKYKTLILPEQVTLQHFPFLAEVTMKQYQTGMSNLWQAIATKPEADPQHQQALIKCQQFSQNLIKQLNAHRQTQGTQQVNGQATAAQQTTTNSQANQANQANQARAPSQPPQQQVSTQQASQNQTQNASQSTEDQSQSQKPVQQPMQLQLVTSDQQMELPPEVKQRVENMHFEAPNNLQGDAAANWRAEAQKRYSRALLDQYKAKANIVRAEQLIQTAHSKGQEVPPGVHEAKKVEEEKFRNGQQLIDSLTRAQNANKAPAAQAAARVIQQTNAQMQTQNGDNRPSSQGQTAINPAIAAAQQQMRTSMTPPMQGQQQQMGPTASHLGQNNGFAHPQQSFNLQRPQPNPTQATQMKYPTPPTSLAPGSLANQSPVPLTHQAAVAAAARSHSQATPGGIPQLTSQGSFTQNMDSKATNKYPTSFNKNWTPQTPQPANMQATARPTLTGLNSGPMGVMGQPAIQKQPPFLLQGQGDRVLDKKKLDELVRQVTGGSGEGLQPEVEEVSNSGSSFPSRSATNLCFPSPSSNWPMNSSTMLLLVHAS